MSDHREILKHWDLPKIISWEEIKTNKVFKIICDDHSIYILKQEPAGDELSQKRLGFQHRVLAHLNKVGIPVLTPRPTPENLTYIVQNKNRYTLSEYIEHDEGWPEQTPARNFNIGQAIAKLHAGLRNCTTENLGFDIYVNRLGYDMYEQWLPRCRELLTGHDLDIVNQFAETIPSNLIQTIEKLDTQLIHRDLHGGNIIMKGIQVAGFVDFDILSIGPRIFDLSYLGTQTLRYAVESKQRIKAWCVSMAGIVEGYAQTTQIPITTEEQLLFAYFMQEVALRFVFSCRNTGRSALPLETELATLNWLNEHQTLLKTMVAERLDE